MRMYYYLDRYTERLRLDIVIRDSRLSLSSRQQIEQLIERARNRRISPIAYESENQAFKTQGQSILIRGGDTNRNAWIAFTAAKKLGRSVHHLSLRKLSENYVGDAKKYLDKVFQRAARVGAILFFDEADSLFGRPEGYANLEVSYLLQKIDAYDGLVLFSIENSEVELGMLTQPFPHYINI